MNKKTDLLKNTLILTAGRFSAQLITLFLLPLYTIYLSPNELGFVDLVVTYVTLLAPLLTIQMEMAAFRFLVDAREDEKQREIVISNILQIVSILAVVLSLVFLISSRIFNVRYPMLILLNVLAAIAVNLFAQIARGLGDNKRYAKASIVISISTLMSFGAFVVLAGKGVSGVLASLALANLSCAIYLFLSLKLYKQVNIKTKSLGLKKKLFEYSLPLVPNGISWWVISVSDRTIISIFLGLAANGIYAVSNKYAAIFSSFFMIFSMALTEAASMHVNAKDGEKFLSETNSTSIKLFGAFGLLLIAGAPLVFKLFIGPNFQQASQYVPILIVAALCNAIVGIYSAIYVAKKMTKQVATTSIMAAIINIVLTVGLIKYLGIYAAALATVAAYLSMAIFRHYDLKKYIHLTYEKGLFLKVGAAYSLVIALYYLHNPIANVANIVLAAGIAVMLNRSTISSAKDMALGFIKINRK